MISGGGIGLLWALSTATTKINSVGSPMVFCLLPKLKRQTFEAPAVAEEVLFKAVHLPRDEPKWQ
jgi:hypothetical protein